MRYPGRNQPSIFGASFAQRFSRWRPAGAFFLLFLFWALLLAPGPCRAREPAPDSDSSLADLQRSIQETIELEQDRLEGYRRELHRLQDMKMSLAAAVNAYQIQLSTFGNLLLSPSAGLDSLQRAWAELRTSLAGLQEQIEETAQRSDASAAERVNTGRQQELVAQQIADLEKIAAGRAEAASLLKEARRLSGLLTEKERSLESIEQLRQSRLSRLKELRDSFVELSARFEEQIGEKRARHLFQRRKSPLSSEAWNLLVGESRRLADQVRALLLPRFWMQEAVQLWEGAGLVLFSFSALLIVFLLLLVRLRRGLLSLENHPTRMRLGAWHLLALELVNRSLLLTGAALFVWLCSQLDVFYLSTPSTRLAAYLLLAALATRWARLALSFWKEQGRLTPETADRLRRLVMVVRYFAWAHLLLQWALGAAAGLVLIGRLLFELWLIGWLFSFWRFAESRNSAEAPAASPVWAGYGNTAGRAAGYLIAGTALLMDMLGFGALSVHWLVSWGRSLVVALWWAVFFFLLREWDYFYRQKSDAERDELVHDEYPFQWLMIRFGQLVWVISAGIALVLAWGGKQVVLSRIYEGLGRSLEIGSMKFSLLGLIYAILVLLATHAVARLWRRIFQTRILSRSGMEAGLQDSITTITVYVVWMLGILVALHVFGLNTASLAVAFGALGIGLGFGLQNIFNNFISGIILLFERPIQVGDDVEINGTWATVRKINVRSTVVQTYDNASIIIPNADFVSSQVTNWSFKDKRLRRNIYVGVAYGSDVSLVRDTLLEIARKTPKVLAQPAPDVLFSDFGDSALIFRLRLWTDIDHMLTVETAIRFEIDRLFRERGIEISFPQRDIHIRSWKPAAKVAVETGSEGEAKPGEK